MDEELSGFFKKDGSIKLTQDWAFNTTSDNKQIQSHHDPNHSNSLCRKSYVDYKISNETTGDRNFHERHKITGLVKGTQDSDSINKKQLDDAIAGIGTSNFVLKNNPVVTNVLNLSKNRLANLADPVRMPDGVNKRYLVSYTNTRFVSVSHPEMAGNLDMNSHKVTEVLSSNRKW